MAERNSDLIEFYVDKYKMKDILSDDLIEELALFNFKPREYVIRMHEPLRRLYFFVEGKAKVFMTMENGKSLLMRFYKPFEMIGDVEFACYQHHICYLQAISSVTCLGIEIESVRKRIESSAKLLLFICNSLGQKLATFNTASAINQTYPLENRLASYLIAVSATDEDKLKIVKEIHTGNLTELASLLGTSYRQLTRVIRKFKESGILERENNEFVILDPEGLQALSSDIYG